MTFEKLLRRWRAREPGPDPAVLRAVDASGLFDPAWYVHRYPDVAAFPTGALAHFCLHGLRELRDPSPDVSLSKYLARTPAARAESLPAALRTLAAMTVLDRAGACLPDDDASLEYLIRRDALFDDSWYRARNPDLDLADGAALRHFIEHGMYELRDPSAAFDADHYRDRYPDYGARSRTPFEHFVRIGRDLGYAGRGEADRRHSTSDALRLLGSSDLFDPAWYVHRYADVQTFPWGPLVHFHLHGFKERRDPSPYVSLSNYVHRTPRARTASLPDVFDTLGSLTLRDRAAAAGSDDDESLDYLIRRYGLFDERWYLARNPDVAHSGLEPLRHFIRHGMYELRDPGPAFDGEFHRDHHPDYEDRGRTPFEDYVKVGRRLGQPGIGPSKYQRWLAAFDTLTARDLDRIRADGARRGSPAVACHVLDAAACARIGPVLAMWDDQVGVACAVRFVRGAGVPDDAWNRAASLVRGGRATAVADPGTVLDDLAADTVVLLCGDGALVRPHAAFVLSRALTGADAAYADHDHLTADGVRAGPVFKPAMSPEFMRRVPYAGPLVAAVLRDGSRTRLGAAVAAAAAGGEAADAWASLLLDLPRGRVARVPFVLFHQPGEPDPAAILEPVPRSPSDARGATAAAPARPVRASIVIPTRDRVTLLRDCIDSLTAGTDYPAGCMDIVVVDNGSEEEATLAYFAELGGRPDVTVVPSPGPFNFSKICNDGAAHATGAVLVFLNNDVTVKRRDWLRTLVRHATEPDVGPVGARLLFPDGSVQHGGVVLGLQGVGGHRLLGTTADLVERVDVTREMLAVTGACLAIRREVFQALGGFDPVLQVAFNDVKLCADAFAAGYRTLYVAQSLFHHHESKSRGYDDTTLKQRRNLREAIYVRERYPALLRDDPSYSPNLSLTRLGELATPRVVRPWRGSPAGERRVLLLSRVHDQGSGVAVVVRQQALFLRERGWAVTVGGPIRARDLDFEGCTRVDVRTPETAAAHAVEHGVDCVIAHTPPFFSVTRALGARPLVYFVDHGEPTPHLFPDRDYREGVDWEKRFCAPLARRVFTISRTVFRHQYRDDAIVLRNGNAHMAAWSGAWAGRRRALRARLGLEGCFAVLNVCRFGRGERFYKGIDRYGEVASDLPYRHPDLAGRVRFILAGRGDEDDVATARAMGLTVLANPSDAEMTEVYAASDLYLNLSAWEGYNLGIGQALAMGLDVVASDIEAHREFGVEVLNGIPELCAAVAKRCANWDEDARGREASIQGWDVPLTRLAETIERDVEEAASGLP